MSAGPTPSSFGVEGKMTWKQYSSFCVLFLRQPHRACPTSKSTNPEARLHRRRREQRWEYELLHTRADWFHSINSQAEGRRAAAGTGRRARRVARDRTAFCRRVVGNGSWSPPDRDYVVTRSETRCAERAPAEWSAPSDHRGVLHPLTCTSESTRAPSGECSRDWRHSHKGWADRGIWWDTSGRYKVSVNSCWWMIAKRAVISRPIPAVFPRP